MSHPFDDHQRHLTRRTFLGDATRGIGTHRARLAPLPRRWPTPRAPPRRATAGSPALPHFAPKAKRVLCLFQSGGLSHVDLFDDKPALHEHAGQEIPPSVKGNQRLTGMTSGQAAYPVVPPLRAGKRCGQHGTWISDLLPHIQGIADDICIVKIAAHRGDQPRPGHHLHEHRQPAARLRQHGRLGQLRPRQREREPARVHRHGLAGHGQEPRPADLLAPLGQRLPALVAPGRRPAPRRQPGALPRQPARRRPRPAPRAARRPRAAQRPPRPASSAIPKRSRASTPTKWPSACRRRCRS